jgi:NhaP-type Na+/H+ or K+/H+ antiporter
MKSLGISVLYLAAFASAQTVVSLGLSLPLEDGGECARAWVSVAFAERAVAAAAAAPWWPANTSLRLEYLPALDPYGAWASASTFVSSPSTASVVRAGIIGPSGRERASAVQLVTRRAGVPQLGYDAVSVSITSPVTVPSTSASGAVFFRLPATEALTAGALWAFIDSQGWNRLALMSSEDEGGVASSAALRSAWQASASSHNGDSEPQTWESSLTFAPGNVEDVDECLERLVEGTSRVIVVLCGVSDGSLIMQRASARGMRGKGWTFLGSDWVQEATWATAEDAGGSTPSGSAHRMLSDDPNAAARATVLAEMQGVVGVVQTPSMPGAGAVLGPFALSFTLGALQAVDHSAFFRTGSGAAPLPVIDESSCPRLFTPPLTTGLGPDPYAVFMFDAVWAAASAAADALAAAAVTANGMPQPPGTPAFAPSSAAAILAVGGVDRPSPLTGTGLHFLDNGDRYGCAPTLVNVHGTELVPIATWGSRVRRAPVGSPTGVIEEGLPPWAGSWLFSGMPITWSSGDSRTPPDRAEHEDGASAMALAIALTGMAAALTAGAILHKVHVEWLPESAATVLVGMVLAVFLRLFASPTLKAAMSFNNGLFYFVLLPIIIFESGYALQRPIFFTNLGSISLFAIGGTLISAAVIGAIIYAAGVAGLVTALSWEEAASFASLMSATDPVATLAVFSELNVDATLNALVYGESVLNDAVGLAAYTTFTSFLVNDVTDRRMAAAFARFTALLTVSVLVGTAAAAGATLAIRLLHVPNALKRHKAREGDGEEAAETPPISPSPAAAASFLALSAQKLRQNAAKSANRVGRLLKSGTQVVRHGMQNALRGALLGRGTRAQEDEVEHGGDGGESDVLAGLGETALLLLFSYISFAGAEAMHLSGIVSALFAGIAMASYTRPIMSLPGRRVSSAFFKMLASLADTAVFLAIGIHVVLISGQGLLDMPFTALTIVGCLVGRAANIFPIAAILNLGRKRKIPVNFQAQMFHSGLRGAIAFASALTFPTQHKRMIVNTTAFVCLFTIFGMGCTTTASLKALKVPYGENQPPAPVPDVGERPSPLSAHLKRGDALIRRALYGRTLLALVTEAEAARAAAAEGEDFDVRTYASRKAQEGLLLPAGGTPRADGHHHAERSGEELLPLALSPILSQEKLIDVQHIRLEDDVELRFDAGTAEAVAACGVQPPSLPEGLSGLDSGDSVLTAHRTADGEWASLEDAAAGVADWGALPGSPNAAKRRGGRSSSVAEASDPF